MIFRRSDSKANIDIFLLTHNRIEDTKRCIQNIYDYTKDFKLFILDNNSNDGTQSYISELYETHDNISYCFYDFNYGIIRGRNMIYNFSIRANFYPSEYICFIDNDQFVTKAWLDSYMVRIKNGFDIVGAEGWAMRNDFYPIRKALSTDDRFHYVGCGGMVTKRSIFEKLGLFDERFHPMFFEDPDLCFKAYEAGIKMCWNTDKCILHKPHNLLGNRLEKQKYFIRSWELFKEKWKDFSLPLLSNL